MGLIAKLTAPGRIRQLGAVSFSATRHSEAEAFDTPRRPPASGEDSTPPIFAKHMTNPAASFGVCFAGGVLCALSQKLGTGAPDFWDKCLPLQQNLRGGPQSEVAPLSNDAYFFAVVNQILASLLEMVSPLALKHPSSLF